MKDGKVWNKNFLMENRICVLVCSCKDNSLALVITQDNSDKKERLFASLISKHENDYLILDG